MQKMLKKLSEKLGAKSDQISCQNFDFCACPNHNVLKRDAGGKKGKLLCCKQVFDWSKAKLAEIQTKSHQNVEKTHFLQKVPGVNRLIT